MCGLQQMRGPASVGLQRMCIPASAYFTCLLPPPTPCTLPPPALRRCEAAGQLLILAAQLGKGSVLKPLLAFGASLEAVDEHGHQGPALLHAASAGNVSIVRALLEASYLQ